MYLDDAHAYVQPREIRPAPKIDPRLLSFAQEARGAGRGHTVGRAPRGFSRTNICVYENGRHVYSGDNCPHYGGKPTPPGSPAESAPIFFRPMSPQRTGGGAGFDATLEAFSG